MTKLMQSALDISHIDIIGTIGDYSHDNVQFLPDHGADFLRRHLETAISDKEDGSVLSLFTGRQSSSQSRTDRVTDTTPENLADSSNVLRESSLPDPEVRSTSFCNDDIVLAQPAADSRPEPDVRDGDILRMDQVAIGSLVRGDWSRLEVQLAHPLDHLTEHTLHPDLRVVRVSDLDPITVEINGVQLTDAVGETGRVEIRLQCSNAEDQVCAFDSFPHTLIRAISGVDTAVVGQGFINGTLAHRRDKSR